jgi:HAD superfamily hydrolase (TIGR01509 family)
MISTIAFDYAGVLEIAERNIVDEIIEYMNITLEKWNSVYHTLNYLCNVEGKTWGEVAILTVEKLGGTQEQVVKIQEIMRLNALSKKVNLGLIEIIKKLKPNYTIALISNYPPHLREKLVKQNLIELFDEIIISGEVGFQKPQPEIFLLLCERLKITPQELVFIDDSKKSLEGASDIGYTPILYRSNQHLELDLKELHIIY